MTLPVVIALAIITYRVRYDQLRFPQRVHNCYMVSMRSRWSRAGGVSESHKCKCNRFSIWLLTHYQESRRYTKP